MKDILLNILDNYKIAKNTYEMTLGCEGDDHGISAPGQFINIKLEGLYLRRPISVCDYTEDKLVIIYKTVGKGTEIMSKMSSGNRLQVLTPLGNGYETLNYGNKPLLVGGGAGIPPMYGLAKALLAKNKKPIVILGFNSSDEVFYKEKFEELGVDTYCCTADGSAYTKGVVTDIISDLDFSYFYTCGPEPMLKAVDSVIDKKIEGQISFEERMGCGFGACMGCSCITKYGSKRICKEGPVLKRGEIIW